MVSADVRLGLGIGLWLDGTLSVWGAFDLSAVWTLVARAASPLQLRHRLVRNPVCGSEPGLVPGREKEGTAHVMKWQTQNCITYSRRGRIDKKKEYPQCYI